MVERLLQEASTFAGSIDGLLVLVLVLVGFWLVLAEAVFFWLIFRFREKPGVGTQYITGKEKHLKRWITTHGFALNVATELDYFSGIVACGLPDVRLTSIQRLTGTAPPLSEVAAVYARCFAAVFGRRLVPMDAAAPAGGR